MSNATYNRPYRHSCSPVFSLGFFSSCANVGVDATRAATFLEKSDLASWNASLTAAETPVASADPWDFTTVPLRPKNTPPLTRLGSIRFFKRRIEVNAKREASRDRGV